MIIQKGIWENLFFTEEFPNIRSEATEIVNYEIDKRTPANLSRNAQPFSGTTNYKPLYLGEYEDGIEGGRVAKMALLYDNRLKFTCWSTSTKHARKIASLFEGIMQKYYYFLRQFVQIMVYEGRKEGMMDITHGDARYYGIPLYFFVRTSEQFNLREDEVRNIKINTKVVYDIINQDDY